MSKGMGFVRDCCHIAHPAQPLAAKVIKSLQSLSKKKSESQAFSQLSTGWWFGTFFIFPYIGNNHPNWLSYFSEGFKPPTSQSSTEWTHFRGSIPIKNFPQSMRSKKFPWFSTFSDQWPGHVGTGGAHGEGTTNSNRRAFRHTGRMGCKLGPQRKKLSLLVKYGLW